MTRPAAQTREVGAGRPQALNVTLEVDREISDEIIERAVIRTVAAHGNLAADRPPQIQQLDLRHVAPDMRRAAAFGAAEEFCYTQFEERGPRVRAQHVRLGTSSLIVLAIDPRRCDAWSANIIADEVSGYVDAHLDGTEADALAADDGPGLLARRAARARGVQGQEARRAARERADTLSPLWWPPLTPDDATHPSPQSRLRDLDDTTAEALTARCRTARTSIFPLALLSLQLLQSDPVEPRAVVSTFAARESEEDFEAVGHLAVDVLIPVTLRGLTVSEALTAIRDDVFGVLGGPLLPWHEVTDDTHHGRGLTLSVLYLPAQLSGGSTTTTSHVARASVSVCPTGADLDLFVIESPPIDEHGRTPMLRLGGTVNRSVPHLELSTILDRWAACLSELVSSDVPWDEQSWPEVAQRMKEEATP